MLSITASLKKKITCRRKLYLILVLSLLPKLFFKVIFQHLLNGKINLSFLNLLQKEHGGISENPGTVPLKYDLITQRGGGGLRLLKR